MLLWNELSLELAARCHTSAHRDFKRVSVRVEHEGLSFLTITLPQFGKDFERSLESGCVSKQLFQGFSWKGGLPKFLSGFLCQVFDASSGRLLEDPNIEAILAIRQLTLMYGKMFQLTTKEREHAAMRAYLECENEVERNVAEGVDQHAMRAELRRMANLVAGRVHRVVELSLPFGGGCRSGSAVETALPQRPADTGGRSAYHYAPRPLVPVHGPGATADGLKGNQKWKLNTWPKRLDEVFPMADFMIPNYSYYEELGEVNLVEPEAETPVKVVSVPKTQKTPRIIAIEPTCMMFMQKALQKRFYEEVERDYLLNAFIGFTDQTPNQELAREGSLSGDLATLDLSEASDRVNCLHVADLFRHTPELLEAVMACRSTKADVQGNVINLAKYASMGSALTFPIEAMLFLCLIFIGIERELKRPLTRRDLYGYVGKVRVFGDDIVVPIDCVDSVIGVLESFGMKVNRNKSFWTGRFRESCGKEYYAGHDVSITRVRRPAPTSLKDAQELISWVDMSNQFFRAGLWQTTRFLDSMISRILKTYPVVAETSPVLGRYSYCGYQTDRVGGRYQSPLVKGFVKVADLPRNSLDDHYALLKWFSLRGELPFADEDHLERSGRPFVVDIKRRWASPF